VQKVSRHLIARIVSVAFEVERKVFFHYAQHGQQTLTARGAKFSNYAILWICIIVMHIKLGTCVPNLRGR
jgi:hypothetical protein